MSVRCARDVIRKSRTVQLANNGNADFLHPTCKPVAAETRRQKVSVGV